MPRGVKKEHLPTKICVTCGRPFTWRKKWERVWEEVTTCSKSCNRKRREQSRRDKKLGVMSDCDREGELRVDDDELSSFDHSRGNALVEDADDDSLSEDTSSLEGFDSKEQQNQGSGSRSEESLRNSVEMDDPVARAKAERKTAKKARKAARRAQREGRRDPTAGQKPCSMCCKSVDLLIRCTYDESGEWKMVCGKCWSVASGGVVDGDAQHPYYRYGGLWKNRRGVN